ncbi:hypothetical protein EAG11_16285 [Flavobacterium sp. 140616W15]|nr:hypothetical protein EAG11_16285 [Flavobacterium sp. 140616W15]
MIRNINKFKKNIMLKTILNLAGVQELTRSEQKTFHGGRACNLDGSCPTGSKCVSDCKFNEICRPNSYAEC